MKKIGTIYREACEKELSNKIDSSSTIFVISYSGLTSNDLNALRSNLRQAGANMFVAKNSMAKKVFDRTACADISSLITGPTGFLFIKDDPVVLAKVVKEFAKEKEKFVIFGGSMNNKILKPADITTLAALPSKEVLLGMLVCGLKAPITASVISLKQLLVKLAVVINRVKEKQESK